MTETKAGPGLAPGTPAAALPEPTVYRAATLIVRELRRLHGRAEHVLDALLSAETHADERWLQSGRLEHKHERDHMMDARFVAERLAEELWDALGAAEQAAG